MKSNLTLTSLLVFLLTGCGNTDSTSVSTKHIYMKAYVYETDEDNESSAYINVVMREDSTLKPEIYLSDGEYLTASFDGEKEVRLEEREIGEAVWPIFSLRGVWSDFRYTAEIPTSGEIGTFTITFHRLDGSKIPMRVEMVERVMLSSPTVDDIFFENQSIPLQWSLPYWRDTQMELETQFFCQDYTFIKEQKNYDIDDKEMNMFFNDDENTDDEYFIRFTSQTPFKKLHKEKQYTITYDCGWYNIKNKQGLFAKLQSIE